jgi:hypothetical protein
VINTSHVFKRYEISEHCLTAAMQEVRTFIDRDVNKARALIDALISVDKQFSDIETAVVTTQAVVEWLFHHDFQYEFAEQVAAAAEDRCKKLHAKIDMQWANGGQNVDQPRPNAVVASSGNEMKQISASVEVQVEIKEDGKIKKGGKQVLAAALYQKHVTHAEVPMTNQEFIELLIDELQMTKAGATTYRFNMSKQFPRPSHS